METPENITPEIGDLIWGLNDNFVYLVANRAINVGAEYAVFSLSSVQNGGCWHGGSADLSLGGLMIGISNSSGSFCFYPEEGVLFPVRPVVSLPANLLVQEVNGVYDLVY